MDINTIASIWAAVAATVAWPLARWMERLRERLEVAAQFHRQPDGGVLITVSIENGRDFGFILESIAWGPELPGQSPPMSPFGDEVLRSGEKRDMEVVAHAQPAESFDRASVTLRYRRVGSKRVREKRIISGALPALVIRDDKSLDARLAVLDATHREVDHPHGDVDAPDLPLDQRQHEEVRRDEEERGSRHAAASPLLGSRTDNGPSRSSARSASISSSACR